VRCLWSSLHILRIQLSLPVKALEEKPKLKHMLGWKISCNLEQRLNMETIVEKFWNQPVLVFKNAEYFEAMQKDVQIAILEPSKQKSITLRNRELLVDKKES
jgi:hypothetical protein